MRGDERILEERKLEEIGGDKRRLEERRLEEIRED